MQPLSDPRFGNISLEPVMSNEAVIDGGLPVSGVSEPVTVCLFLIMLASVGLAKKRFKY